MREGSGLASFAQESYWFGAVGVGGASAFSAPQLSTEPTLTGFTLRERSGILSGLVTGALVFGLAAAGASAPTVTVTEGQRNPDTGRSYETWTYETPSPGATGEHVSAAAHGAGGLASLRGQQFELDVYQRGWAGSGSGDASGYKLNMLFSPVLSEHLWVMVGWGWGSVHTHVQDPGFEPVDVEYFYFGVPVRVVVPISFLALSATWEWNIADHFTSERESVTEDADGFLKRVEVRPHPLMLDAQAAWGPLFIGGGVEASRLPDFEFGYRAMAGWRL